MKKGIFLIFFLVLGLLGVRIYFFISPQYVASGVINLEEIKNKNLGKIIELKELGDNFVMVLKNGRVYEDGLILTKNNKLIEDVTILAYGKKIENHRLLRYEKTKNDPKIKHFSGKLAVLSGPGANNYYHWLFQIVPKIKLLQQSGVEWDKIYLLGIKKKFQKETLRLLNISKDELFIGEEDTIVVAKELIVPSIPVWLMKGKSYMSWVIEFLNDSLNNKKIENTKKRIYISRNKTNARKALNEEELLRFLEQYGFTKVYLEDLRIDQQAKLFKQAEIIIGAHGAGLSNIVFANSSATLIEITEMRKDHPNSAFKRLTEKKKMKYYRFQANDKRIDDSIHAYNFTIDIPLFKKFLSSHKIINNEKQ